MMGSIFTSLYLKIETTIIQLVCIIQNEEQQLQRSALPDDEGKESSKGGAGPEAYPDSEAYHYATSRHHPAALRLVIWLCNRYYTFFITHFWIFLLISRPPNGRSYRV